MFQSFTVKNFRCFRDLTLEPLERVNLIAGKNNTGKTALLEAIHLHSYPRDSVLPFTLNVQRGLSMETQFDEDGCRWLFHNKDGASGFELRSRKETQEERTLQVWLMDTAVADERFPELAAAMRQVPRTTWQRGYGWLILKATSKDSETVAIACPYSSATSSATSTGCPSVGSSAVPWNGPSLFLPACGRSLNEDAIAFSALEGENRQAEILPDLKQLEPRLERLSLLLMAGQSIVHGSIEGLGRQVPVLFMGDGIRRLLSILLAINAAAGGVVLIDEIENGLHHSVLVPVWRAIAQAARRSDVQVFATSHSYECIQAAHQAFSAAGPYDLRLFRLDRLDNGLRVAVYNQNILNTAIDMNLEVR